MKQILRTGPISVALGWLIWVWMVVLSRTIRWRVDGLEGAEAHWARKGGIIVAAWHETILVLPTGWTRWMRHWRGRTGPGAMLISLSPDAEPVARAIRHLGLEAIRGSKANKRKKDKNKGGQRALVEALKLLRSGGALCITPDGPTGPARQVGDGAILLAQRSGAPLLPYALAVPSARRLKTWDRFMLPMPFARGSIVFGEPICVGRGDDVAGVRTLLQERMDAATARAEQLAALGQDTAVYAE